MLGTPVICSVASVSVEFVRNSGFGGVFHSGDRDALSSLLTAMLMKELLPCREYQQLANWAECLRVAACVGYLRSIF